MWPLPGEALDRTVLAEQAIADLYREAFSRWAPEAATAVLPSLGLTAATDPEPQQEELPPDTAALTTATTTGAWLSTAELVVIAGVGLLWAVAVVEAMEALGIPLPSLPDLDRAAPVVDARVMRIVNRSVPDMTPEQIQRAAEIVDASPALTAARDSVLEEHRAEVEKIPALLQAKVEAAVQAAQLEPPVADVEPAPLPTVTDQRQAASRALDPEGDTLHTVSQTRGQDGAGVLNNAVVVAAQQQNEEFGEQLEKCWIATLDARTREGHWAADGQRVPIDGFFTVSGEPMFVPGDRSASPSNWKNCRCRVGILAADEPLPDEIDRHTERLDGRDSVVVNRDGRTQAEEIERRRRAGNVRARDTSDGVGRVASVNEEHVMTDLVEVDVIDEPEPDFAAELTALVAASTVAEPRLRTYDPKLFSDPKLTRPTAPTMNNETGRIYGHLAEWGHVIRGGRDVTPRNRNGYRNFHTSQVQTADGRQLSVGRLTVQGGHASTERGVTAATARAHYDDVTTAFGLVRVGEDRFGIWFSGVPAPGVDPEVFQQGMTAQLSGDWRDCEGAPLDMIAAHAVNSPGFPIYSAQTGPDGREMALVASLGPQRRGVTPTHVLASVDDVKAAVAEVLADERRTAELAARRDAALTAAHANVGEPPAPLTPSEKVAELLAINSLVAGVSTMPAQFKKYWGPGGIGGAKIRWGTDGDFDRCVRMVNAKVTEKHGSPLPPNEIRGLCSNLHREYLGKNPGEH